MPFVIAKVRNEPSYRAYWYCEKHNTAMCDQSAVCCLCERIGEDNRIPVNFYVK